MSLKCSAILGLSMALVWTLGMAEYPGAPANGELVDTPAAGKSIDTDSPALFPELADEGRGGVQVAMNGASLAGLMAQTTLLSQVDCNLIYLDFSANPRRGPAPLDVTFTDLSVVPPQFGVVETVEWFPQGANGPTIIQDVLGGEDNVTFRYPEPGIYDVCFRIQVNGEWCPPRGVDGAGVPLPPFCRPGWVVVNDESQEEEPPTASLEFNELLRDKHALPPLSDWVPLWNFTIGYDLDEEQGPANRLVRQLVYVIKHDPRTEDDLGYRNVTGPTTADLLEFGLFKEGECLCEDNNTLDTTYDVPLITWAAEGGPEKELIDRFGRVEGSVVGIDLPSGEVLAPITYTVRFLGTNNQPLNPADPPGSAVNTEDGLQGNSYILAVRTSALWQSGITMSCDIISLSMIDPDSGSEPRDDEGELLDSVPDFPLNPEIGYSSSFTVADATGTLGGNWQPIFFDTWNRPRFAYAPIAEWIRPRWETATGELRGVNVPWIDMRELVSLETWRPALAINLHSTNTFHFDSLDFLTQYPSGIAPVRIDGLDKDAAQLEEVNVVITDIGADPADPGSGGLDPRDAFESIVDGYNPMNIAGATADGITFNGVWVWHDTNNNGQFDAPTPTGNGVIFNGDFPMFSMGTFDFDFRNGDYEYIPFPPGGGDPWWKLKLRFLEGRRRDLDAISDPDNPDYLSGYVEAIPDGGALSQVFADYFVVVRADSGERDSSTIVRDGVGMPTGADFRVFVEPRRFNPITGIQDGGIYVNSMIPGVGARVSETVIDTAWQDDPRWYVDEPWWNQRTMNQNSAKPLRQGVEVHDLTLVYESSSPYSGVTVYNAGKEVGTSGLEGLSVLFGFNLAASAEPSSFDIWMDPFGLEMAKFYHAYSVDISRFAFSVSGLGAFGLPIGGTDGLSAGQFAYEQGPFLNYDDFLPAGPRSDLYPNPPAQPTLPSFDNWPARTAMNVYPRATDWPKSARQTRLLTQKTDILNDHTAMLGINLVGADDPSVNGARIALTNVYVAFWGPDFSPTDLAPLDPEGLDYDSGVLLWEDSDTNGIFLGAPLRDILFPYINPPDTPVQLSNLTWPTAPELIDLDGDGQPEDMDGDGFVDSRDRAWVLKMAPQQTWTLPDTDNRGGLNVTVIPDESGAKAADGSENVEKALAPAGVHAGDDLFISVRFSDKARRFEKLRAVVPASLPERAGTGRRAGIQFFPEVKTAPDAFVKVSPEEDPVQDYYGFDTLEVNVPVKIFRFGSAFDTVVPGGPAKALMGVDISTNRPEGTVASGGGGQGGVKTFTVAGAGWAADAFVGDYLVDEGYESYEITGNTDDTLALLSGEPLSGRWRIASEPTFLEYLFIEIYPDSDDFSASSGFNAEDDLLPLNIDQEISGVALYRDNDMHPGNRNGYWDPDIDIPVQLDAEPDFIGEASEATQVRFVFSTPGTDEYPMPRANQPRRRQWIQDSFGTGTSHPDFGSDFFIVVRPSANLKEADAFRIGLVAWGPNTPTAPDMDTWTNAWSLAGSGPLPAEQRHEYVKFWDFPWADVPLGFVTMFKTPPVTYSMDGIVARAEADNSGANFLRTSCTKKVQSNLFVAADQPVGPRTLVIDNTTPENSQGFTELPSQILPGQVVGFSILGQAFGSSPQVRLSGYDVTVTNAADTWIDVTVTVSAGTAPHEPLALVVRNPETGDEASRQDLFKLVTGTVAPRPVVSGVSPAKAAQSDFPVAITGSNFDAAGGVEVRFGRTLMPVGPVTTTSIQVSFPVGGLPTSGLLDVSVKNLASDLEGVASGAFEYVNPAIRPTLVCGASQDGASRLADVLVIVAAAALLLAFGGRKRVAACARRLS